MDDTLAWTININNPKNLNLRVLVMLRLFPVDFSLNCFVGVFIYTDR